ncbi:ricin-type beta-trefoil lectin domain protein [Olivibacter ginsenosidimutans]|uniref:galactosylceramidase n=1 Tax=Olivibacter ginsenosidimutans TaxID=1176537 RepID=A0ABP9BXR7_9SPHI
MNVKINHILALTIGCLLTGWSYTQHKPNHLVEATSKVIHAADTTIRLNLADQGLTFDGIGAISAGASSRLLYDYPEPERSQILDYLFKPNYGAALQLLKVEIGSDMNSTDGSEASHMRTPDELNGDRGYEWWLMAEAKKRNPDIKLYALAWGAPGWVGEFWSDKTMDYLLAWLDLATKKGFKMDYIGGWNERGFDADWYIRFNKRLKAKYPNIRLVGADAVHKPWAIATEMTKNQALRDAVDIVGEHSACGWRTPYTYCGTPDDARSLQKPLWNSEHSSMGHDVGAKPLARAFNRLYIDGRVTGNLSWALVSAWYASYPIGDTGLLLAEWPWSGYYSVAKSIWAHAHTTQFVRPGWQYLDGACGYLPTGASYVSLKSPANDQYSMIIETIDAQASQKLTVDLPAALKDKTVYCWVTDMNSSEANGYFINRGTLPTHNGHVELTLEPGFLYTISTTTGQHKGTAQAKNRLSKRMKLPYSEDFEKYGAAKLARYFADVNGAFEIVAAGGGRKGYTYRQMVTQQPVSWWHGTMAPATLMGDPQWWGDYAVSVDALLHDAEYVELLARVSAQAGTSIVGYHLQLNRTGQWKLYSHDFAKGSDVMLSSGTPFERNHFVLDSGKVQIDPKVWHQLKLDMKGDKIDIIIDGKQVGDIQDNYHLTGQAGILVSPWHRAEFDNFRITPTAKVPEFIPQQNIRVIHASSEHAAFTQGYTYAAANAVDGRPETAWNTEWEPKAKLPHTLTLDLGKAYEVNGLICQPKLASNINGVITGYNVYLSTDGKSYEAVAKGKWPKSSTTRLVKWPRVKNVRFVKFEATDGVNGSASIGELQIIGK